MKHLSITAEVALDEQGDWRTHIHVKGPGIDEQMVSPMKFPSAELAQTHAEFCINAAIASAEKDTGCKATVTSNRVTLTGSEQVH